jgi:GrpB-like predicted nucleotidyltransferase (UPF0157 family)
VTDATGPRRGPMTEVELRAAWVREAPRLTDVVRLERIGSTSVPGVAATPIVDVPLVAPDSRSRAP